MTTNNHALAIIDGVIVDNLTGRQAGDRREVRHVWKVTGNIKPNIGIVNKSDTLPKKRFAKLNYGEEVIYKGKIIKYKDIILAKKGDLVRVNTQQASGLVVLKFFHPVNNYTITAKLDRELFQVTKERNANIFLDENIIKKVNNMAKDLTLERLAEAIIKTKKEVMYLKTELEKVQSYLREQHKLKKQLNNK